MCRLMRRRPARAPEATARSPGVSRVPVRVARPPLVADLTNEIDNAPTTRTPGCIATAHDRRDATLVTLRRLLHDGAQGPSRFSDAAVAKVEELQAANMDEVGTAAVRRARHNRGDVVSAVDVEEADRAVRAGSSARRAWTEAFGGVLAGAGTGTFVQIATQQHPAVLGLSICAGLAAGGLVTMTAALFGRRR